MELPLKVFFQCIIILGVNVYSTYTLIYNQT